jgi:hypothetical protein
MKQLHEHRQLTSYYMIGSCNGHRPQNKCLLCIFSGVKGAYEWIRHGPWAIFLRFGGRYCEPFKLGQNRNWGPKPFRLSRMVS